MIQRWRKTLTQATALLIATGTILSGGGASADLTDGYPTHAELSDRIDRLVAAHPGVCVAEPIGTSREGRTIHALRLARPGSADPDERPAMLIVANIDGDHIVGSAVALDVASSLLEQAGEVDSDAGRFLTDHTLYVVPRVNPDAAERFFAPVRNEQRRNTRPDDRDRDGVLDEDPPNDLDGDGMITMMRVPDLDEADMMPDPGDARLDASPDRVEGERVVFHLLVEGIDDDEDGAYNEDDLGGVDLNMNFMHGYEEHADGAGPYQVSEPESLALIDFVLSHQNIAIALTYGRHDTLSKAPDGKGEYPSGAPKNIVADDVALYEHISERFVEITELKEVPSAESGGSFHAWAYAQFGIPSFATPLWTRPEPADDEEEGEETSAAEGAAPAGDQAAEEGDEGLTPSGIGDIAMETLEDLKAAAEARGFEVTEEMVSGLTASDVEQFAKQMGIEVRRVKGAGRSGGGGGDEDGIAWLKYSDEEREGSGFVAWKPFEHPQLGPVEIGGWTPYFKSTPPSAEIESLAAKQVEFVLDLAGRFPDVSLGDAEVKRLAPGIYEVQIALVNNGGLPTGTAMAVRNRRARPIVVRLDVPNEQIVTGQRINRVWSVPASGGREKFRWIVRAEDGGELLIVVHSEKYDGFERLIKLDANAGGGA